LDPNFTVDLTAEGIPVLFGKRVYESSDAPSATATTTVDNAVMVGDFSQFVIVDKVAPSVEFIPNLFHTSNNRPSGNRGWLMHWRVGSDSVNDNAFTLLQVGTTA
jgi:HK97 family phage major capsid protein